MTVTDDFRFGVVLTVEGRSRADLVRVCRRAESLGYDVISMPEHVNLPSPVPFAVLAAEATRRSTIGTYVLNVCFHRPALLVRDVSTLARLLGDRLEVGIGTGYVEWEFDACGLPFGTPGSRVDRLVDAVAALRAADGDTPLLIGGHGDRVLRIAARDADIVSFVGARYRREYGRMTVATAAEMTQRVKHVREVTGGRRVAPRFNLLSKATVLTTDRRSAADGLRRYGPDLTTDELLEVPTLFVGTASQIADQVRAQRQTLGIDYITVLEPALDAFGDVIALLRG
jgi:probable F420-dependent oxidoreductase